METETIITIVTAALSLIGSGALFIVRIRKAANEKNILKEQKEKEIQLRKKEERDKFYLITASNLVMSAERLNLTGAQKKEYVMTWLENEAVKAGMEVNKAIMSVAIERAVLLMNDHRNLDKPFAGIIDKDVAEQTTKEQERIEAETQKALAENAKTTVETAAFLGEGVELAQSSLTEVKDLLKKANKRSIK